MASSYRYPHSVINNFLADFLENAGLLSKTVTVLRNKKQVTYGTIIGEEMVPEIAGASAQGNDYIVFSLQRDDSEHNEYEKHETMAYNIFTRGKVKGYDIMDEVANCLGRRDFTTDDLQNYQIEKKGKESFHFFDIEYNTLGVSEAMNNGKEAGYYMGTVLIRYSYTYEMDSRGRRIKL